MKPLLVPLAVGFAAAVSVFAVDSDQESGSDKAATHGLPHPLEATRSPELWRAEGRLMDVHMHVEGRPERFARAVKIMDGAGIGTGVILGAGSVTAAEGQLSEFERVKALADQHQPGRFACFMLLDFTGWDEPGWSERAAEQITKGHRLGAAGLKEFKRLGLFLKDSTGTLIKIDDPKLDAVWRTCGELGLPVSIHVADPKAFWDPYDETNERWTELKDHPSWWFGDPAKHPPRMDLLNALDRVIARHRGTTFVCVHFANNAEELEWVDAALSRNPNMMADIAARVPEIGRHDPAVVRGLFEKHQDRILLGTDFMVYSKLILGSGGDNDLPGDEDALEFYRKTWKWFETSDQDWEHMTPIQGDWTISSIHLAPEVLRKVYFDNARKLLAASLPLPTARAMHISRDFVPDGVLDEPEWAEAQPQRLEYQSGDSTALPEISTPVRVLWSDRYLYLSYECPFVELNTFEPPHDGERMGLWENDVVEAFICGDPANLKGYTEYQWAPNGERLDLKLDLPDRDFDWNSGMESTVIVDADAKVWRVEARIPLESLSSTKPQAGSRWRLNFFRHDRHHNAGLAFSPTLARTFHVPERFGWLVFDP
jgi:predicted TIM-barrel fold metal-dependent hydrolase